VQQADAIGKLYKRRSQPYRQALPLQVPDAHCPFRLQVAPDESFDTQAEPLQKYAVAHDVSPDGELLGQDVAQAELLAQA
jgi:hypothetical protein